MCNCKPSVLVSSLLCIFTLAKLFIVEMATSNGSSEVRNVARELSRKAETVKAIRADLVTLSHFTIELEKIFEAADGRLEGDDALVDSLRGLLNVVENIEASGKGGAALWSKHFSSRLGKWKRQVIVALNQTCQRCSQGDEMENAILDCIRYLVESPALNDEEKGQEEATEAALQRIGDPEGMAEDAKNAVINKCGKEPPPKHLATFCDAVGQHGFLLGYRDSDSPQSSSKNEENEDPPSFFICPISRDIMTDPVVAMDGRTCAHHHPNSNLLFSGMIDAYMHMGLIGNRRYDRPYIEEYFERVERSKSPMTRRIMQSPILVPNHDLQAAIEEWVRQKGRSVQHGLANANTGDERVDMALNSVQNARSTAIDLSGRRLEPEKVKAVAATVRDSTRVNELKLSHCRVEWTGARALADGIRASSSLNVVRLDGNCIGRMGGVAIGHALSGNAPLRVLDLTGNKMGDVPTTALACSLAQSRTLTELRLIGNQIGVEGADGLGQALRQNASLERLVLSGNALGDKGAEAIALGVGKHRGLRELNLNANKIGNHGGKLVARALKGRCVSLETLYMNRNLLSDEAGQAFAQALRANHRISELELEHCRMMPETCGLIKRAWRHRSIRLNLKGNPAPRRT